MCNRIYAASKVVTYSNNQYTKLRNVILLSYLCTFQIVQNSLK